MSTPGLDETTKHMLLAVQESNDGLWDWNLVTNEFYLSPHWKEILGFADDELPNSYDAWREHVHPEDLPVALLALQRHFDGSTPYYQLEYRLRHKDGSYRWFFLHGSSLCDASGSPLRAFGWHTDITERKQEEAQRTRCLALRAEVSLALTERSSLPTMLQRCCQALQDHLQVAWAFIWLAEEAEMALDLWASNTCDPALLDEQYCDPAFALTLGHIAWRRQPYLTNDVSNDPYLGTSDWVERECISAFAGYPLLVEERVVGVMALFSRERFSTETLELLALLANAIAQGIGRKWAEEALKARVQQQTRELELLLEISHAAPSTRNLSALLDSLLVQLKTVVDYSGAALYCIQDDQLSLLAQHYPFVGTLSAPTINQGATGARGSRAYEASFNNSFTSVGAENSFTQVHRLIVQEALKCSGTLSGVERSGTFAPDLPGEGQRWQVSPCENPLTPSDLRGPIIINDLHTDPRFVQLYLRVLEYAPAMAWQIRSWMLVPLLVQEQVLAILTLNHSQPHAYTPQHARFAFALATQAAFFALEYPRLATQAHTYASFLERIHQVRELHEAVAIHLSTIQNCTQQIRKALVSDSTAAMAPLRTAQLLARMGLADLHALDVELQPELLETEGLIVVLKRYLAAIRLRRNVPVEERLGTEPQLPVKSKYALYRIVQQALYQFSSHALASAIMLRLEQQEQTVVLEVRAEGLGFDEHDSWLSRPGLRTIRKYAEQLDAQLSIGMAPENGTTLNVRFPLSD